MYYIYKLYVCHGPPSPEINLFWEDSTNSTIIWTENPPASHFKPLPFTNNQAPPGHLHD